MSSDALPSDNSEATGPNRLGGAARLLGIEPQEASAERVVLTMPVTSDHHQPFGLLHGGVSVVLAETAASIGGHLAAPEGATAVGIEVNANHVRPVREGRVTATAAPLHTGRTTQVWEVKIQNEEERLVCASRLTLAVVDQAEGPASV